MTNSLNALLVRVLPLAVVAVMAAAGCGSDKASCPTCPGHSHCDEASTTCVCDANFTGDPSKGACTPSEGCYDGLCRHGTCDDSTGIAVCTCEPHFTGDLCVSCEAGWVAYMDGCITDPCTPDYCGPIENGSCSVGAQGAPVCSCITGYTGDHCEQCADGYVKLMEDPFTCVKDACNPSPCVHGTCALDAGALAVCTCEPGWAKPFCANPAISACQLATPSAQTAAVGSTVQVGAEVFVENGTAETGAFPGITAKACFAYPGDAAIQAPVNLDLLDCEAASFAADSGVRDLYKASTAGLPSQAGTFSYVFGFSGDGGESWTVCDSAGISTTSVAPGTVTFQ